MSSKDRELEELGLSEDVGDLMEECIKGPGVFLKIPARGRTRLCMLTDRPFKYTGHFVGGRMRPCTGSTTCEFCRLGYGKKVRYVLSMYDSKLCVAGVLEVAPASYQMIWRVTEEKGFGKGMVFEAWKEGGVQNGRINFQFMHSILANRDLPSPPDVVAIFRKMREDEREHRPLIGEAREGAQS